jgi:hypothetical protein
MPDSPDHRPEAAGRQDSHQPRRAVYRLEQQRNYSPSRVRWTRPGARLDRCKPGSWATFGVHVVHDRAELGELGEVRRCQSLQVAGSVQAAEGYPYQVAVAGDRASVVACLKWCATDRAAWSWCRHARDTAASNTIRSTVRARGLMPFRVGAYAVDGEASEARCGSDFRGFEFDDPVVHFAHIDDAADRTAAFGNDFRAWSAAVPSGESDQCAGLVVAYGGERAALTGDDDARATTEHLTVSRSDTICEAD